MMSEHKRKIAIIGAVIAAMGSAAYAAVEVYYNGQAQRGMTMTEVRAQFGEPATVDGPIGEPAVTTWTMQDGEVVVFVEEYTHDAFVVRAQ